MTLAACSAAALLLSACESNGGARFAGVGAGSPGSGSGSGSGGGGTDGGSTGGGSTGGGSTGGGGTGTGSGTGAGGSTGSGSGGTGTGSSGSTLSTALQQVSPVLVTAGNAVLGVADGQGNVTTPIATALPVAQPVTGTITRVLTDTGTVLVDAGEGRTLLLQGAQGVVGDVVSINVADRTITTGLNGTTGAIGLGTLGDTQPPGAVASLGVLNAGNSALATVNGIADVRVTNVTAPTGGIADNLLNVALSGNQTLGTGDPALVNASLLPGGVTAPATGSVTGPVTGVVGAVTGAGGTGGLGSTVQQVTGGLLSPVGVTADATAGSSTSASTGATTNPGGALAPVTGAVSGTVNNLTTGLGLTN